MTEAITDGAIEGHASSDTFEHIDFYIIDKALTLADKFSCDTNTSKDLILVSTLVRRLRAAVVEELWDSVEKTVGEAKASQATTADLKVAHAGGHVLILNPPSPLVGGVIS